jgi:glycerol transport system ATP-binding protein
MTLELRNVSKRVGVELHIHETNVVLARTGFNILLGATNAGKTSLIKLMSGLDRPTTGQIFMNDRDVTGVSPQKRNISLVHQFFVNYPNMTVFENIASPLRVAGVKDAEVTRRVHEAADILKLGPMLKRRPSELSGGQQQRTALARAIVKESELVLLDEPLANLDYKLREELRDQLPTLFAGRGAVVVYATSEPSEALLLGGHTATVFQGRITQFGETAALYHHPRDLDTAEVFSDPPINTAKVNKRGHEFHLNETVKWRASEAAEGLSDGEYTVGIRPHFVTPSAVSAGETAITGVVRVTELSGSESVAHFSVGDGLTWVALSNGVQPYQVGTEHRFWIDTERCMYFAPDGRLAA